MGWNQLNDTVTKYLIWTVDGLAILIALATLLYEHGAHVISLAIFPALSLISGVSYVRKKRRVFLIHQVLFLYLLILESIFWVMSHGHNALIIAATIIPFISVAVYTLLFSEREKLKTWIIEFFK